MDKKLNIDLPHVFQMKNIKNFRELGEYKTKNGKTLKKNVLYRSGNFSKLKKEEYKKFNALNIKTLIDFRSDEERKEKPNLFPKNHSINIVPLPILNTGNSILPTEVKNIIQTKQYDSMNPHEIMMSTYKQLAVDFHEQYKIFFALLLSSEGAPVLWHCTAGKDRTGFAAAVLLKILGVDNETILKDYLVSTKYSTLSPISFFLLQLFHDKAAVDFVKEFLTVKEEWLLTAFESIDENWGSFETYQKQALQVSDEDVRTLKNFYLSK